MRRLELCSQDVSFPRHVLQLVVLGDKPRSKRVEGCSEFLSHVHQSFIIARVGMSLGSLIAG
jgi:hypothetical protein